MALTPQEKAEVSKYFSDINFVANQVTANWNTDDIKAGVTAIDNAFDATLNQAVAAVGGTTTIINGLNQIIPAPVSGGTAQQKTLMVCYVLMKRVGII